MVLWRCRTGRGTVINDSYMQKLSSAGAYLYPFQLQAANDFGLFSRTKSTLNGTCVQCVASAMYNWRQSCINSYDFGIFFPWQGRPPSIHASIHSVPQSTAGNGNRVVEAHCSVVQHILSSRPVMLHISRFKVGGLSHTHTMVWLKANSQHAWACPLVGLFTRGLRHPWHAHVWL